MIPFKMAQPFCLAAWRTKSDTLLAWADHLQVAPLAEHARGHAPTGSGRGERSPHAGAFGGQDATQHQDAVRRHRTNQPGGKTLQHIGLNVGQHELGLPSGQTGDEVAREKLHAAGELVERGVLPAHAHRFGIVVETADDEGIVLSAPLAPNANYKGTAFGGSLFSIAVLTGCRPASIPATSTQTPPSPLP